MPSSPSPSSSVQAARKALADRLRELREAKDMSAQDFSKAAGWHKSKTSRIERAAQPVTPADIRIWCSVLQAEDHVPDLIAALQSAEGMYVEWRRLERTGLRRLQQSYVPLFQQTRHMRIYQPHVIPGLFQTPDYIRALLTKITDFRAISNDVEDAVTARLERRRVLTEGNRRFAVILEQCVLAYRLGGTQVMLEQLAHLSEVMSLPSVSIGIIPSSMERPLWALEGFTLYDDTEAHIELLTASVKVTAPSELALYSKAFEELAQIAVYGAAARELIRATIAGV